MTDADLILVDDKAPQIYPAMIAILAELPAIGKDQKNDQQKFMFRGIDAVQRELSPLCGKHGVFFLPTVLAREEATRQTKGGGLLYVVHLHVQFTFYAADGSSVSASAWGEGSDSGDKATPKAHTGAMKIALLEAFNIATEESSRQDGDHETPEDSEPYVPPPDGWESWVEHKEFRDSIRSRALALPLDAQHELAQWFSGHGFSWPRLTAGQADEYAEFMAGLEAKAAAIAPPDADSE